MLFLMIVIGIAPSDLTGFWHSQPDLSEGYESCYFFWDSGEFAHLQSIEEGILYTGDWLIEGDELILVTWDAMRLDGTFLDFSYIETVHDISLYRAKKCRILLDDEFFFLADMNPSEAVISLVPTYGMSNSERDAFSTYD